MNQPGPLHPLPPAHAAAHDGEAALACVCELMDGRLSGDAFAQAVQRLAHDDDARASWHAWHVIGDVMRASDLAACCTHDAAFLARLRQRLQQERQDAPAPHTLPAPVTLPTATAPGLARQPAANDGVFRWKLVAGLASFAAVAAIGWTTLGAIGPQPAGPQLALRGSQGGMAATPLPAPAASSAPARGATALAATTLDGSVLRDPRLDELLAAHRQAAGAPALGHAQGFLRNATFNGPAR